MNTASRSPRSLRPLDYLLLLLSAFAVGLLFLKGPGLGDDFNYWRTGWGIHESGRAGWSTTSFHDLRWPIWGLCWFYQIFFGAGAVSYYLTAFTYLWLGAAIVYSLGGKLLSSRWGGWACAIAFLFHPLLDQVVFRPMPDLPEGVFAGAIVLCWLALVEAGSRRSRLLLALATGLILGVAFSSRFTGVLLYGVLGAVALVSLFNTRRLQWKEAALWLGVIGLTGIAFFCVEGLIYQQITGDFLHNIHANMGAKGKRGTDAVNVLLLPFRFLDGITGRYFIGPFYLALSILGGIALAWKGGLRGRVIVAWAVVLYLGYACALQSFFPPRPMLRDADRFLSALSLPLSILAVGGAGALLSLYRQQLRVGKRTLLSAALIIGLLFAVGIHPAIVGILTGVAILSSLFPLYQWVRRYAPLVAFIAVIFLIDRSRRSFFDPGYLPAVRAYMEQLEDGTTIFTHRKMRFAAYLAAPERAAKMNWVIQSNILHRDPAAEEKARQADELWFCRKLVWLSDRKAIWRDELHTQTPLASYFIEPQKEWKLMEVINVANVPEFVFYRKRPAGEPTPPLIEANTLFPDLPAMPIEWKGEGGFRISRDFPIPEALQGRSIAIQFEGRANYVQAFRVKFIFFREKGGERLEEISMRPYLHPTDGVDFHHLAFPREATFARIEITLDEQATEITVNHLYLLRE